MPDFLSPAQDWPTQLFSPGDERRPEGMGGRLGRASWGAWRKLPQEERRVFQAGGRNEVGKGQAGSPGSDLSADSTLQPCQLRPQDLLCATFQICSLAQATKLRLWEARG